MAEILCSVVVDGDPTTVFDYVCDSDLHSLWQRDLRREKPAPNMVTGSRWTELRRVGTRELRIDVTVTDSNRPERIEYVGESGGFSGEGVIEFHAQGTQTRIVQRAKVRGRGIRAALAPVVARQAQRVIQADLFRLTFRFARVAK